ncbi:CU044_2847 family protein [Stenomitos frigidus]|uniref:CU044_2847 family protein n=1 Tax=Stenomitos frigidus TaxID=1886765 RepID=UPI001F54CDEC|nr:CU044_2847 family protein [Phormidium sp. FACHB-592]
MVLKARQSLEETLENVKPVAAMVLNKLKSGLTTPVDEVEMKFALKLSAEAGVIFSSVGERSTPRHTLRERRRS